MPLPASLLALLVVSASLSAAPSSPAAGDLRGRVLETMKRATSFMVERVAYEGGYVWNYLPDMSRRWGELEARPSMIWIQSGTPSMGNVFLDAYHATGDEYYYDAAAAAGLALVAAQLPCGGWNYLADFAGDDSLREWYGTIGRNAWRLEEFQHYCGNATFDDSTTPDAANYMLRLYLEKRETRFREPLERAIQFVLEAQYPMGGWPQRFPPVADEAGSGVECPEYARYVTLNDRVGAENVEFLLACYGTLGERRLLDPVRRGLEAFLLLQQPAPQAGWALQYTPEDLAPAGARTYEPAAIVTHTTASCIEELMSFYRMTGERRFLQRIPEAFAWLQSVRLPAREGEGEGGLFPTFVEVGSNLPLYIHRVGSNARNGHYVVDHDPNHLIGHYGSTRRIDLNALRERFEELREASIEPPEEGAFLRAEAVPRELPRYKGGRGPMFSARFGTGYVEARLGRIIESLNPDGYWPAPLRFTSHPYVGDGPREIAPGDFGSGFVGDETDTSPYRAESPAIGISINSYMGNMSALIRFLATGE